jgi:S1-C subfamily serine protease
MARSVARAPLLVSLTLALAANAAPLRAQRNDPKRAPRASSSDSLEQQLRRLKSAVDSLGNQFYNEDLSAAERRRVGTELDRIITQYRVRSVRLAQLAAENQARSFVQVQVGPITSAAAAASNMANALTESIAREATPRGWIGIVLSGAATEARVERGEMILHYFSYPVIASVDPSSPAQRAGLAPNDTLLAYNGRDVRDADISMTRLLRPNAKVVVRVRRDARVHEFPVIVAETPARIRQRRDDEMHDTRTTWALTGPPSAPVFPRAPTPPPAVVGVPRTPRGPMSVGVTAPLPPLPPIFSFITNGIAGAQMVTVTEGLGRTLGLQSGVLVANAPAGSPAAESGLRDGDVIVKVEGQLVRNVAELRDLIARAVENGDRSVELETVRERRTLRVTLRR